jgi:hypothetical protein
MIPVQMIRVVVGDNAIQVPVFLLPFAGGQDGFARTGGFFIGKEGEYGVIVDGRVPFEEIPRVATEEIRKNLPKLTSLVNAQFEALKREQRQHMS